uniref:Uncharacterized protein n=1 Tax=Aurelia sp. 4 sensu Dawson et al. (2005) TaxID=237397 RepID=A0A0E4B8P7_9CNID|nr:hypothetical protein [Aurelia sp. 4 sensu Dawson et al. (2005)]
MRIIKSTSHNELTLHILLACPINRSTLSKVNSQLNKHTPNYLTSWIWLFVAGKYYTVSSPKIRQSSYLLRNRDIILQKIKMFSTQYNPNFSEITLICKFSNPRT